MMRRLILLLGVLLPVFATAHELLIEAEAFARKGGWSVDQQFMETMGSAYLLAHGAGRPVADAETDVTLPAAGTWHVYVRTYNWTSPWFDGEGPGGFRVGIGDDLLPVTAGVKGDCWQWQYLGKTKMRSRDVTLRLHDLTGFDGRCDAVYLSTSRNDALPDDAAGMEQLRKRLNPAGAAVQEAGDYDFVVVGGGVAGMCAAVSAARLGLRVALVHDRPVLGGNNSSEVRVHLSGVIEAGPYPNLGNLVKEFGQTRRGNAMPGDYYEDERKMEFVTAEPNISLFLSCRGTGVEMDGSRIAALLARNILTGELLRFRAPLFADCTGDAGIGSMAGADFRMGRESRADYGEASAPEQGDAMVMGASVLWYAEERDHAVDFPEFVYGKIFTDESVEAVTQSKWTWETGLNRDQVAEAERVRDHGLLSAYANWSFLKNRAAVRDDYRNYDLAWVSYVAGKRESRRLLGDVVLTQNDVVEQRPYDDASVTTSWWIDLHYPDPANTKFFPGEEFKAICKQEPVEFYPIPYRCFYSRNIENLFMAGRNISVTHVALGTVRVMRTTAMMGEVVGMAASICRQHDAQPRAVYTEYLPELKALMEQGCGKQGLPNNQRFNLGRWKELEQQPNAK